MIVPTFDEPAVSRYMTSVFYGRNHTYSTKDGESFEQKNISNDYYPVMSNRKERGLISLVSDAQGLLYKDAPLYISGTKLFFNGNEVSGVTLSVDPEMMPKQMVSMGAYVVIFPDGVYFNTANTSDKGSINATFSTVSGNPVTYTLCDADGSAYSGYTVSEVEPTEPSNGDYWLDTLSSPHTLKQYTSYTSSWVEIATTYIKIGYAGIGTNFAKGDGITVSGATGGSSEAVQAQINALNGDCVIQAAGADYLVVVGILDETVTQTTGSVTARREAPQMDYVCESNNRLWGCKYGTVGGQMLNEIYASKLGDFKNWRVYDGLSTDSYAVSVGSDGKWTGAITYNNYPTFFKEGCVHQIYGAYPAQYQVVHTKLQGVKDGSFRSLVSESGFLFYQSPSGFMVYGGNSATDISQSFGDDQYADAVCGAFDGKVYCSMRNVANDTYSLFVYDTQKQFWVKEDDTQVRFFAANEHDLFYIDSIGNMYCVNHTQGSMENADEIPWETVSGVLGYDTPDQKYMSRFVLRMCLSERGHANLAIQYDSDGIWHEYATLHGQGIRSFEVPVVPRRCDHLQWRLKGTGAFKLFSCARLYEGGSDIYR